VDFDAAELVPGPLWTPRSVPERTDALAVVLAAVLEMAGSFDVYDDATLEHLAFALATAASPGAALFHFPDETRDWVIDVAESMPTDVTFDVAGLPSPDGVLVFEHQVWTPGGDGDPCPLRGVVWSSARRVDDRDAVTVTFLADSFDHDQVNPSGWSVWAQGERVDAPVTAGAADAHQWDRKFLAAAWYLITSRSRSRVDEVVPDRAARRRAAREGRREPSPVRVVHLHDARHGERGAGTDGGEVEHRSRWWVSGHWRSQAYGPQWSLRRPVWIAPHVKGPEDAPVVERRTVRTVDPT
jgi:hypothetical protein